MLRFGIVASILCLVAIILAQVARPLSEDFPIQTVWDVTHKLPSGRDLVLRYELEETGTTIDGGRVIVPCVGQADEINLKGWRDDSFGAETYSWDSQIRSTIKRELMIGRDGAEPGRDFVRREQTRIEMSLSQMYRTRPEEGSGPRPNEVVYRYRYQRVHLFVRIGKSDFKHRLSTYFIPMVKPVVESTKPCGSEPKETACSYGGFGIQTTGNASYALPPVSRQESGYVGATIDVGVAEAVNKSGLNVTGVDINTATISNVSFADVPSVRWIFLPIGTVLVPGKGGIQSMITVDPALLTPTQYAELLEGEVPEKSIAVHCLEIDKAAPDSSITFSLGRTPDPILRNLAMMTQRSAIKGPWDQARIWIYTDKAPLERINKRLVLGCPPGMYVRSLWEVHTSGGLTDKDLANPDLFKSEYLGGICNRKEAMAWFVGIMTTHHAKELANYLSTGGKEFASLIASTNPLAQGQFTKVVTQLMIHSSPEVRLGILQFLDGQDVVALKKAIGKPAPAWDRFVEEEGLEGELGKKLQNKWN